MAILIDVGANRGKKIVDLHNKYPEHTIIAIEANLDLVKTYCDVSKQIGRPIMAIWAAAGTYDGMRSFYMSKNDESSTMMLGKKSFNPKRFPVPNYSEPIEVPTIDLSRLILEFSPHKNLVVKMDIEGGEYEIVPHLFMTGALERINELYCEWHEDRFDSITTEFHEECLSMVNKSVGKHHKWG